MYFLFNNIICNLFLCDSQTQFRLYLLQTVLSGFVLLFKLFLQFVDVYDWSREAQISFCGVSSFLLKVLLVDIRSNLWTTKSMDCFLFFDCLNKGPNNFLVSR